MPNSVTLTPEARGPLSVYPIKSVRHFGVEAFVTDRFGGVSGAPYDSLNLGEHVDDVPEHVAENRRRVAEAAGVTIDRLIVVRQVHGIEVAVANAVTPETEADILLTYGDDLALIILVADCVPILLVDEISPRICVVHAGWKGLQRGVLATAISHFEQPNAVHAFIGPCISAEAYQVGPEVATLFRDVAGAVVPDTGDRSRLDLSAITLAQLNRLGVGDERITIAQQSTDGGEVFFSDRAQRPCGRFGLVAKRIVI